MIGRAASLLFIFAVTSSGLAFGEKVISTTKFKLGGHPATIEIVMTDGRFYNDDMGWCGGGEKWEGQFEFRVRSDHKLLCKTPLNRFFNPDSSSLFFWSPKFKLTMHDYNRDGAMDFNLGQYGACNWNEYRIFTIRRDGSVSELPCPDGKEHTISVSHASRENSTPEIKMHRGRMTSTYYDNTLNPSAYITEQRVWKRSRFVLVSGKPAHPSS
jgi:hypothetical protein